MRSRTWASEGMTLSEVKGFGHRHGTHGNLP